MFVVDELILILGVLLFLGIISNLLSSRLGVPVLVLFLMLGMLAGSEGLGGIAFEDYPLAHGIGSLALALILFDGGLSTRMESVLSAWKPALALATVGVLITAGVTGIAAAWILNLSWLEGLLLGSIVGSTDAAAIFTIIRHSGARLPDRIASTLEVESGTNDPMAIFLTIGCIELLAGRVTLGWSLLMPFASQMIIGLVVGLGFGILAVWLVNRIQLGAAGLYPVLVTSFCLLTFGLAAFLGGSGFLAVYLCGMVLGNRRLVFQRGILIYHDALAWLSQIAMFVLLGLLSFPSRLLAIGWKALLIALILILLSRPAACLVCLLPFRIGWRPLMLISWVGLKGAVPIVLATFPLMLGSPNAPLLFDAIFFIVVLSALVQGSTLPAVTRFLRLDQPQEPEPPLTLELSALRQVEGDIVDYSIGSDSRAAGKLVKNLALPEGVVIALLVRGEQFLPPKGTTRILAGDHAILVLRPETRPLVNQIFARSEEQRGTIPPAFEFPLRANITCGELSEFYGILLNVEPETTLSQLFQQKLAPEKPRPGESIRVGPLLLHVRSVDQNQQIEMVGMTILSAEEIRAAERKHEIQ